MIKIYSIFFICVFLFFVHYSIGQEVLYYENFESDHSFTLNTIDNNNFFILKFLLFNCERFYL